MRRSKRERYKRARSVRAGAERVISRGISYVRVLVLARRVVLGVRVIFARLVVVVHHRYNRGPIEKKSPLSLPFPEAQDN